MSSRRPIGSARKMRGSIGARLAHDRREIHLVENVALDVDARRDFDEFQALRVSRNTQRSVM